MERALRWENTRNRRRADKTESLVFSCFGCSLTLVELISGKGLNRSGVLLLLAVLYMVIINEDIQLQSSLLPFKNLDTTSCCGMLSSL